MAARLNITDVELISGPSFYTEIDISSVQHSICEMSLSLNSSFPISIFWKSNTSICPSKSQTSQTKQKIHKERKKRARSKKTATQQYRKLQGSRSATRTVARVSHPAHRSIAYAGGHSYP